MIKSRRVRWAEHAAQMRRRRQKKKNAYGLLVGEPKGSRLLGRPRHGCVHNIKMDLGEIGWGDVD
jgi:hypothetical protein